ncbi:unnamed protein product [Rotaria sordida]|uniref:Uncharacterized protein n=1 Tax=Rotaria sordida TaxID=392033 RepID=A0A815BSF6_9BILA|nr:unnamed protein product [Rotaria sordida]
MTDRIQSSMQNVSSCLRSQSCHDSRDKVNRTVSALHRQTVDRAQRHFEKQLAKSEREVQLAMNQRRDYSSSSAEKIQATQYLEHLRSTLNNDYTQLIQAYVHEHKDKVDEIEKHMNQRHGEECQLEKTIAQRTLQEALQEAQLQSEKIRLESINQVIRERDAICEEKLAAQKIRYNRLLDEQAQRLRAEQVLQTNESSTFIEHIDMAELKGRLARVEYEHRELKQLIIDLRTDLSDIFIQQPKYRSTVNIPNFVAKP